MTIRNTKQLITLLRKVFSRRDLADTIGTSVPTIIRWEEGGLARAEFAKGFGRAIKQMADEFEQADGIAKAIEALKPIVRR